MKIQLTHSFEELISVENILSAWQEFKKGKRERVDVREFEFNLIDNVFDLHASLHNHTYKHGKYQAFNVYDPKPRNIHKASVRDRILHRAVYRILYPFFDKIFISDSFSCRNRKGTHRAVNRFRTFGYRAGKNNTRTCWILKCDIKKFFASIDHKIFLEILHLYIPDKEITWILKEIIESFYSTKSGIGLPLGNLTSQLFANVYMNELDQFIKHELKVKYYIRYADDFVILSDNKFWLENTLVRIEEFLDDKLNLKLHPDKIFIKTLNSGIDFLGYVSLPHCRILRTRTKKRMFKRINQNNVQSYLGILSHCKSYKLKNKLVRGILELYG
jgi:RNA-directed DNA polymerase